MTLRWHAGSGKTDLEPKFRFSEFASGPKPVLRKTFGAPLTGLNPATFQRNKFVPLKAETRRRLKRQIPKLPKATSESGSNLGRY
jgi:hypothetical protein